MESRILREGYVRFGGEGAETCRAQPGKARLPLPYYISDALGKATIDTKTHGQTKGKSGSYSTNFQMSGRELLTPDEVRGLDNRYAILFIRGAKPVMDLKYELTEHPAIRHTIDGGGPPYIHHQEKPEPKFQGEPLFAPETEISDEEKEIETYEDFPEVPDPQEAPEHPGAPEED